MGSHKRISGWFLRFLVFLLAVMVITVILAVLHSNSQKKQWSEGESKSRQTYRTIAYDGEKYKYNTDLMNVLCIGVDAKDIGMEGQADTIYLMVLDRGEERIQIISISRDSVVPIQVFDPSGRKVGWAKDHLALSYSYGSNVSGRSLLTAEAVSAMFHDIPVVYYAAASLMSISDMQELVGEFTVEIPGDDLEYLGETYKKGNRITIQAENVELFLRSRDSGENFTNTGRMNRQRAYLEAYLNKLKELLQTDFTGMVGKISKLQKQIGTNVALDETEAFAEMLLTYRCDFEKDYYVVEGTQQEGVFHDDYIVDEEALSELILNIFYEKERSLN